MRLKDTFQTTRDFSYGMLLIKMPQCSVKNDADNQWLFVTWSTIQPTYKWNKFLYAVWNDMAIRLPFSVKLAIFETKTWGYRRTLLVSTALFETSHFEQKF